MGKRKLRKIEVKGTEIRLFGKDNSEYICLTDIANQFGEARFVIRNWLRTTATLDFLAVWEELHNDSFNRVEFDTVRKQAGGNAFTLSPKKWIEKTDAIGITAKAGRYGGTYAHNDVAMHFCYWASPIFQLYLVKEFQRLKVEEAKQINSEWNVRRIIAKTNYHIHTEAVRENLVPIIDWNTKREAIYHATEADLLNLALFGMTAREWKKANPEAKGNMRDKATIEQLLVLANLETINAEYLELKLDRENRLNRLNQVARKQMEIILSTRVGSLLTGEDENLKLQ
jgi:hypothetical protein